VFFSPRGEPAHHGIDSRIMTEQRKTPIKRLAVIITALALCAALVGTGLAGVALLVS